MSQLAFHKLQTTTHRMEPTPSTRCDAVDNNEELTSNKKMAQTSSCKALNWHQKADDNDKEFK